MYDAIIVPGGGVSADGFPPPWARVRLDRAIELSGEAPILCLSAATVHKAPPLDNSGRPVLEAVAGARYLIQRGFPASRILLEFHSYDTIGNAFFARVCHADLLDWSRLLIVNSEFHMERTKAIFQWVFGLAPVRGYELAFETVPNLGMPEEDLAFRCAREAESLEKLGQVRDRIGTVAGLHRFLFTEHDAYSPEGVLRPRPRSERLERVY